MNVDTVFLMLPVIMFLLFLYMGRDELEFKGIVICLAIAGGLGGMIYLMGWTYYILVGVLAVMDIILIMIIFKGSI